MTRQPQDFGFGDEERMLRDDARRLLAKRAPATAVRALVAPDAEEAYGAAVPPAPYDRELWSQMVELGWTSLAVPTTAGGLGMKMVALAALAEELGRTALPSPLTASLLATCVLRQADDERAKPWLERVAGGTPGTLAITNAAGSWDPGDSDVIAEVVGDRTVLRGTACFVQDARKASFFVVSAKSEKGLGLYAVSAGDAAVSIQPDRIADLTRDQARVALQNVAVAPADVIAMPGEGSSLLERACPALLTVVSADLCGAAEWQLQTTTEYARIRVQFDRPIGFFQAVKHPLVDVMMAIDGARSLVYAAACAIDHAPEKALRLARMAKAAASDAGAFASSRSVQLHGGIGFTWESPIHIYFKRQRHSQVLFGDGIYQREKLGELSDAEGLLPA